MSEEKKTEESLDPTGARDKTKKESCCNSTHCKCDAKDIEENKLLAFISYLWILFLIPLFGKKNSPYAQFHAKQGLALFVFTIIVGFASTIPIIGWFLISWIGGLIILILFIIGLVNSLSGKCEELPLIGKFFRDIKV